MSGTFRSLRFFNFRLWLVGMLVSNIGTWMQFTAQDWVVLTEFTDGDALALGFTLACQFIPTIVLLPLTGFLADRVDRRRLLYWTQGSQGVLGLFLGILIVTGNATLIHIYVCAFLLGVATAIDSPARLAFVSELVNEKHIQNAVALNSMAFHVARIAGPAVGGVLVALIGAGPVFLVNAVSFAAVIATIACLRTRELRSAPRLATAKGQFRDGITYVIGRPDLVVVLIMVFFIGTFGFNFPVYIATIATQVFGQEAAGFGALTSMLSVGSVIGAALVARSERPSIAVMTLAGAAFAVAWAAAAWSPNVWAFGAALLACGVFSLFFMSTANAYLQTTSDEAMRGRVLALYVALFNGGTPIGAPIVGELVNNWGARWGAMVAVAAGIAACIIGASWIHAHRRAQRRSRALVGQ